MKKYPEWCSWFPHRGFWALDTKRECPILQRTHYTARYLIERIRQPFRIWTGRQIGYHFNHNITDEEIDAMLVNVKQDIKDLTRGKEPNRP